METIRPCTKQAKEHMERFEKIRTIKPDMLENTVVQMPIWACTVMGIIGGLILGVVLILILR